MLCIQSCCAVIAQQTSAGVVMPNSHRVATCCIHIPKSGLGIFERPNGPQTGNLVLGKPENVSGIYSALIEKEGIKEDLPLSNFEMVGYDVFALVYTDRTNGFIQLKNGFWIEIRELQSKGLRLTPWMDYVFEKRTEWYANEPGLNLREGPSTDYHKIITLKGDLFGIRPTEETKGKWCKVEVTHYREHPCSGGEDLVIEKYYGWIKLISETLTPNVWHYGKGC